MFISKKNCIFTTKLKFMEIFKKLLKDSILDCVKKNNIDLSNEEMSFLFYDIISELYPVEFNTDDENKICLNIGDIYEVYDIDYLEWVENGNDPEKYMYTKKYDTTVVYVTPDGGYVLEEKNGGFNLNQTFDGMVFSGKSIKMSFPDFDGDVDKYYAVTYSKNNPLYQ